MAEEDDIDEQQVIDDDDQNLSEVDDPEQEESDEDDKNVEEDDEEIVATKSKSDLLKTKRRGSDGGPKKRRKKEKKLRFFVEEAAEAEDSEEDEEVDILDRDRLQEIVPDKEIIAAEQKVAMRHEANREFLRESAEEIAERYRQKHKREQEFKSSYGTVDEINHTSIAVAQEALLPSTKDPKIFKIKCKPGCEMQLVRSILMKTLYLRNKEGGFVKIKSAFCTGSKGFIYVEALNEMFAKETINGLRMMYANSFAQIPVSEMTSVLSVTVKKKPLTLNQFVRIKRGPLKGDLAVVVDLFDGGQRAFIKAVPRPDYTAVEEESDETGKPGRKALSSSSTVNKVRPSQRLFDAQEALLANKNASLRRGYHPLDSSNLPFDIWKNEYYRDGFIFREVNVATFLDDSNVKPSLDEMRLFMGGKKGKKNAREGGNNQAEDDEDDDEDNEEDDEQTAGALTARKNSKSFLKELAKQIENMAGEEEGKEGMNPFVPGDLVKVMRGEMRNLVATVVAVNDATRVARIVPFDSSSNSNSSKGMEVDVEMDLLEKYIFPGAHVKVVAGRYQGQTGKVVNVSEMDGISVAAIMTDGINTEIRCNVSHLQMSTEVTTGQGNLQGYELYDLVALSESEMAVVVLVGAEKLRVINNTGIVKDVHPQELQGKKNHFSGPKAASFDSQHNTIKVGDTVTVTAGEHLKLSGTIKHMIKGMLWLHSDHYMKNSGIFVAKSRNCLVAGGKSSTPVLSNSYGGVLQQSPALGGGGGAGVAGDFGRSPSSVGSVRQGGQDGNQNHGGRGGGGGFMKDASVGKTVKIKSGKFKGLMAQVIDATATHYSVELLARFKKVTIQRSMADTVGDKLGPLEGDRRTAAPANNILGMEPIPSTPFLTQETPRFNYGSETPRFVSGGETPLPNYGYGNRTPGGSRAFGDDSDNVWQINAMDEEDDSPSASSAYGSGTGGGGTGNSGSWAYSRPSTQQSNSSFDPAPSPASNYTLSSLVSNSSGHPANRGGNSVYSLSDNNGFDASPMRAPTPAPAASAPTAAAAAVTFRDWEEGFVVLMTKGSYLGKLCVIIQKPDDDGMLMVDIRDGKGNLENKPLRINAEDAKLAQPVKKCSVKVLAGKLKGKIATVKAAVKNDIILDVDGKAETLKIANCAWINSSD